MRPLAIALHDRVQITICSLCLSLSSSSWLVFVSLFIPSARPLAFCHHHLHPLFLLHLPCLPTGGGNLSAALPSSARNIVRKQRHAAFSRGEGTRCVHHASSHLLTLPHPAPSACCLPPLSLSLSFLFCFCHARSVRPSLLYSPVGLVFSDFSFENEKTRKKNWAVRRTACT